LATGIPLGVLVGDAMWRAVAHSIRVRVTLRLPVGLIVLVPASIAAVNIIAYFPAQAAARGRPAVALRTE
jgi:hypothetical protein